MNNWQDFTKRYKVVEPQKLSGGIWIALIVAFLAGAATVGVMCYWGWL